MKMKNNTEGNVWAMISRLPFDHDWAEYNGKTYFVSSNVDASLKAKKPMMDLHYCATEALNNRVLKTVQFDKNKFRNV